MSANYEMRPTIAADAPGLNALYEKVTGIARSGAVWSWEWREGPFGPAPSFVIVEKASGHIAGHHGVVPLPLALGARAIRGARTENSMVDPDHKGKFIYSAYEAQILADLLKVFDVIFTTAGKGAPGVVRKRLGYVERGAWHTFSPGIAIGHMARRLPGVGGAVATLAGAIERRAPRGLAIEETSDTGRIAQVWRAADRSQRLMPDREAGFLDWRISRHPKTRYTLGAITRGGKDAGAVIWRDAAESNGARMVVVEDLFTVEDSMDDIGDALVALIAHYRGKAARILVRTLNDDSPLANAARQLTAPWRLKGGEGSPVWVRSRHEDLIAAPWTMTQLLTQGN